MDTVYLHQNTPEAARKARQRACARETYGAKPVTLWLAAMELEVVRHYLLRRYGHDGNLRSRRVAAAIEAVKNTPAPCASASQSDQLNLFPHVS